MKVKTFFGALLLSAILSTQGFGFELLDKMLGLSGGCNCCPTCEAACEPVCECTTCEPVADACDPCADACDPCAPATPIRDLFDGLKGLGCGGCCEAACDACAPVEEVACEPACDPCDPCAKPNLLGGLKGLLGNCGGCGQTCCDACADDCGTCEPVIVEDACEPTCDPCAKPKLLDGLKGLLPKCGGCCERPVRRRHRSVRSNHRTSAGGP